MRAWVWLEREGCVAPFPEPDRDTVFIAKRGRKVRNVADIAAYRKASLMPWELIHPLIAERVRSIFLKGEYDAAIASAFECVETEVRKAGEYGPDLYGGKLMLEAFDLERGKLTLKDQLESEKVALRELFAGAMGYCRNPCAHRSVLDDPREAVEMIFLASYLLRIVDSRKPCEDA